MSSHLEINGRRIGPGHAVYIIAELSANHGQRFERAVEAIRVAKSCGADAVKLQTYMPETLTIDSDQRYFRIDGTLWHGRTLFDLYREAYTPWPWHEKLKQIADEAAIDLFSTPFDDSAVDFLEQLNFPAHKIASFENGDLGLLRKVGRTGKPVIVSTGMATLAEIDECVETLHAAGCQQLALLKCTSAYPAPAEAANLATLPHLAAAFGVPVGLSDHTLGTTVPIAAVALGATIIEKHFTLARSEGGPDSAFSLEPAEFKAMVAGIRVAEKAIGAVHYGLSSAEQQSRKFRRSLFAVKDIRRGEILSRENIRSIRPGDGLPPRDLPNVIGRVAARDLTCGTPLSWHAIGEFAAGAVEDAEALRQDLPL